MKLLGLDSSGLVASVAVVEDGTLLAEYTVNYKKTHSQTLLPMLDAVVRMIELDLQEVDAIAVAAGPGSFTGLRIGSATAKGLGFALGKPLIGVPTLDALAYNLWGSDRLVCPMMDARRGQVYTGIYRFSQAVMHRLEGQMAIAAETLVEKINAYRAPVLFLGDGVPVCRALLEERLTVAHAYAPAHLNRQRAGAVAALGQIYWERGECETAADHKPIYLRLPQAERERLLS